MRLKLRELPVDNIWQQQNLGQQLTRVGDAWNVETEQSVLSSFLIEDGGDDFWLHRKKYQNTVSLSLNRSSLTN